MINWLISIEGGISQGILWGILAMAVFLTYRILDFADLSVEGTFALGGSVSAVLIVGGMNPYLTLLIALAAGMAAGLLTGLLHTVFKIPGILAGILTMISMYSINVRIMGKANLALIKFDTVDSLFSSIIQKLLPSVSASQLNTISTIIIGVFVSAVVVTALYMFFGTEIGSAIRATGNNEHMVRALGANTDTMKVLGLVISNGLVALSGALVAQTQGYSDVQMGVGAIVIGLASVIIGEVIFCRKDHSFAYKLGAVIVGSIIYRIIIAIVLRLGMKSTDLKLLTAIIVAVALAVPVIKDRFMSWRRYHKSSPLPGGEEDT